MKKAIGTLLALTMLLTLLLGGCGERDNVKKPSATQTPTHTVAPETMTPDPEDGVVKDDDGILTDDDTGTETVPPVTNDMDTSKGAAGQNQNTATGKAGK